MKTHYSVLGIARNASMQEIKKAYRQLARTLHPDVNSQDPQAESKFKEVQQAYEVLRDTKTKADYDTALDKQDRREGQQSAGSPGGRGKGDARPAGGNRLDPQSMAQDFERFFGISPKKEQAPSTGKNSEAGGHGPLDTTKAFEAFFGRRK